MNGEKQMTLFPVKKADNCYSCAHFAELKTPWTRKDGVVIYGYCFKNDDYDYSPNMGKGYAVFLPEGGPCKSWKKRTAVQP